jgi:hypothetical protein
MRYIDQQKIYEATENGLRIFTHYFDESTIRKTDHYIKARDEEKSASARISWYQGLWRITDYGNQSELNSTPAIQFVRWKENLSYYDALQFIEQVIVKHEVEGKEFAKSKYRPDYSFREMTPDDRKGQYNFIFKEHPSENDLSAFGRYVTEDHLNHFYCKTVESYEYCSSHKKLNRDVVHQFWSTKDFPIFLFDDGSYKKLYKPHEEDKKNRFFYIGDKPDNYIYGLRQILEADNEFIEADPDDESQEPLKRPDNKPNAIVVDLFRCSGESDAINLYSLGFHSYWLNSESKDFTWRMYKEVDDLCRNHYQIMDLDATGQREALKNALKHIDQYTIELPTWLSWKRDWRDNPCKDLKDFINIAGDNEDSTRYEILILKRASMRVKFWSKTTDPKTKKANYNLNMEDFFFFLKANGFYQMDSVYHKKTGYCYVKLEGKSARLIHPDDIKRLVKRFTKDWIRGKKLMGAKEILNKLNGSTQLSEANIDGLESIKLDFKNYDRNTEYLHFRNCSIKITKDKIESIKQTEVPNYILGELYVNQQRITHLIDRDMRVIDKSPIEINATPEYQVLLAKIAGAKTEEERSELHIEESAFRDIDKYDVKINDKFIFAAFLRDLSRIHWRTELDHKMTLTEDEIKEENLMLANLCFVLGYHCAQYKDPGKAWLTLLQDYLISAVGQASGGSGKSLLSKAITFVRMSFYKGGKKLADKNVWQFFYDGLTEFHDFVEVDDMHEHADFTQLYTDITGPREVNPKNYTAIILDYPDSSKMLVSFNYELQNVDPSTVRRLLNSAVSDYYHEKTKSNNYHESRSPLTKFGRRLYDDFTAEEWIKFYNLIAYCIQLQQRFFKIMPNMTNIEKKQLLRTMSSGLGKDQEFLLWANAYFTKSTDTITEFSPDEKGYFNTYINRNTAFLNFKTTLTKQQVDNYKSTKFKTHLEAWCDYKGFELNPDSICTDKDYKRIIKTRNNESKEYFYISTAPKGTAAADKKTGDELPPF